MKLYPVLLFIADYPFLKPARFLFDGIERGILFNHALERARRILSQILIKGSYEFEPERKSFSCLQCEKNCKSICPSKALFSDRIEWESCNLCGECYLVCDFSVNPKIYKDFEVKAKVSFLSYVMMRSAVADFSEAVRRRFSTSLARAYRIAMENDKSEALPEIMASNFNIRLCVSNDTYRVHVTDFLKASSRIRSPEWKLINRKLSGGFVEITRREFFRIVEERLRDLFFEPFGYRMEGIEQLKEIAHSYELRRKSIEVDGVKEVEHFPPCMKKILADIKASENVPHTARFALTSFMLQLSYSVDEILEIFRNAPDFDEDKARYQIEHIAGQRGAGKLYDVPSCSTMKTYQNCVADCNVNHPLEYYRRRVHESGGRKTERRSGRDKADS